MARYCPASHGKCCANGHRAPCTGCNAGITHFHADPHGKVSICKIGHDIRIGLIAEGTAGLRRLAAAGDALITRH